jgi:hypothetical protein
MRYRVRIKVESIVNRAKSLNFISSPESYGPLLSSQPPSIAGTPQPGIGDAGHQSRIAYP